jgi:transposase-like protein
MMRGKRRNHLPEFKAKVALAAIKGDRTLAELSEQFDVHQNEIQDWRKQLLDHADTVFGSGQEHKTADEAHLKDLHAKIGVLALENDFLAKAPGR